MRSSLVMIGFVLMLGPGLHASAADVKAAEVRGHVIGENTADFLRLEPELGQVAGECRQHLGTRPVELSGEDADQTSEPTEVKQTAGPDCAGLLAAVDGGQRLEIANSSSMEFLLNDGKLARLTTRVEGEADAIVADLAKQFGTPSRETSISGQDNMGAKWKSCLLVWETADVSVTLYEDGDPSLQDRRPLLILESRANDQAAYTISVHELATLNASARSSTHPKKSLAR